MIYFCWVDFKFECVCDFFFVYLELFLVGDSDLLAFAFSLGQVHCMLDTAFILRMGLCFHRVLVFIALIWLEVRCKRGL